MPQGPQFGEPLLTDRQRAIAYGIERGVTNDEIALRHEVRPARAPASPRAFRRVQAIDAGRR